MEISTIETAIRNSWDKATCNPVERTNWSSSRPYMGQGVPTSLTLQDYFGGEIAFNRELRHVWNILPDGSEVDLTREQFAPDYWITPDGVLSRDELLQGKIATAADSVIRYAILKNRVALKLMLNTEQDSLQG